MVYKPDLPSGAIVQINPDSRHLVFRGCCMVVKTMTETLLFGYVQGLGQMRARRLVEHPGPAWLYIEWSDVEDTGGVVRFLETE